jgi:hypothetical protein
MALRAQKQVVAVALPGNTTLPEAIDRVHKPGRPHSTAQAFQGCKAGGDTATDGAQQLPFLKNPVNPKK